MSNRKIWLLTVFTALALSALIVVQLTWIKKAIRVQEKQFRQLTNEAMDRIINNLETYEILEDLLEEIDRENDLSIDEIPIDPPVTLGTGDLNLSENEDIFYELDSVGQLGLTIDTRIDLLSGDTVLYITDNTIYGAHSSPSHTRSALSKSDIVANYNDLISNKKIFVERVFNRAVGYEGDIEDRISPLMLHTVIRKEVRSLGEEITFEYAVRKENSEYIFPSKEFDPDSHALKITSQLFPHDISPSPNFLVLFFPNQKGILLQSVGFMASASLILTLIMLIVSLITILIIFRQKKLSEIKNDFINNMTHELKTPISTISLASQMLVDDTVPMDKKSLDRISNLIKEESKRLGNQVEKVLQMSIFDEGKTDLKIKPLQINDLISQVVEKMSLQINQHQATVELELEKGVSTVLADEIHFTNVIYNLLDNALKYCSANPLIRISSANKKAGIIVIISDNGIGISKDHQKRIFEKFFRVPTGNLHDVKGFGLGLSYVKKVLEDHGGYIKVNSEINKGTNFSIFLPYRIN